jgi:hypothetical protein
VITQKSTVFTNRGFKSSVPQDWGCRSHVHLAIIFYCPGTSILTLAVLHGHVYGGLQGANVFIPYPHSSSYQKIMLNWSKILHCLQQLLCYDPVISTEHISFKASWNQCNSLDSKPSYSFTRFDIWSTNYGSCVHITHEGYVRPPGRQSGAVRIHIVYTVFFIALFLCDPSFSDFVKWIYPN